MERAYKLLHYEVLGEEGNEVIRTRRKMKSLGGGGVNRMGRKHRKKQKEG